MDPKIIQAVIEAGSDADDQAMESLEARFPGRGPEIRAARAALADYRSRIRNERQTRESADPKGALEPGSRIGDYVVESILGQGAMGIVYRARQESLGGRAVALKVLPHDLLARDPRFAKRFRREAELASKVHHPHIAEIYGFDPEGDIACFAMRLVEGRNLGDLLARLALRRRLGDARHLQPAYVKRVVTLIRAVADALSAVHERELVHRDVKPANIILEGAGDDELEGLSRPPVLVDFGLVRPIAASELTGSLTLLGTPAFASPELQMGHPVDARADVFSLGAVLHDLLALTDPGERRPATAGLPPIRSLNPAVDVRLAAIVEKATEERPALRYPSGQPLRDDLDRWLEGRPVRANPTTALGRAKRWARRDPARAARRALIVGAALAVIIPATWLAVVVTGLYRTASEAGRLEQVGDIPGAVAALRPLRASTVLAPMLPGLADDIERANGYLDTDRGAGRGLLARAIALLDVRTEEASTRAHKLLVGILLTPAHRPWHAPLLAYLARELGIARPDWRRRLAAETLATYFLIHPVSCPPEGPTDPLEARLESAMLRALEDAKDAKDSRFRQFVVSSASGLIGARAFLALSPYLAHQDMASRQIARTACERIVERLQAERRLREIGNQDWVAWVNELWRGLAPAPQGGSPYARLLRQSNVHAARAVTRLAWLRVTRARGFGEFPVTDLAEEPARILAEITPQVQEMERSGVMTTLSTRSSNPMVDSVLRLGAIRSKFWKKMRAGTPAYVYDNIWDLSETLESKTIPGPAPDPNAQAGGIDFRGTSFDLSGCAKRANWTGARHRPTPESHLPPDKSLWFLECSRPGRSELELELAIPPDTSTATVELMHCHACRWLVSESGSARGRILVNGGAQVIEYRSSYNKTDLLRFEIDRSILSRKPTLELEFQLLSATTTYRIYQVAVAFRPESDE